MEHKRNENRKSATTGTKIYYSCLIGFVLVFFIGVFIGMGALKSWLVSFEAAQPKSKSQEVFIQYFAKPNWAEIYRAAGESDTQFEGAANFAAYMNALVGNQDLTFVETSAGTSGDHKYIVKAGETKIATFTLTADNKDAQVPDWKLGDLSLNYERHAFCTILTVPGNSVTVNGVKLTDDYIVKTISTKAEDHLPKNIHGYQAVVYRVDQLLTTPKVEVMQADGQTLEMTYHADTHSFTHPMGNASQITEDEKTTLVTAAQMYCKYMIGKVSSTTLKNYFDATSDVYYTMTHIDKWMQSFTAYRFEDPTITDFYRYNDNLYSARLDMSLFVTRKKDGTEKEYPLHSTFLLEKQNGIWKVIDMLNMNIQEQEVSVRLTFMDGNNILHSFMVPSDSKTITVPTATSTPAVTVPEGMQLAGWYIVGTDADGKPTHELVFQPDADGKVNLGVALTEPMVLYAHFVAKEA